MTATEALADDTIQADVWVAVGSGPFAADPVSVYRANTGGPVTLRAVRTFGGDHVWYGLRPQIADYLPGGGAVDYGVCWAIVSDGRVVEHGDYGGHANADPSRPSIGELCRRAGVPG